MYSLQPKWPKLCWVGR